MNTRSRLLGATGLVLVGAIGFTVVSIATRPKGFATRSFSAAFEDALERIGLERAAAEPPVAATTLPTNDARAAIEAVAPGASGQDTLGQAYAPADGGMPGGPGDPAALVHVDLAGVRAVLTAYRAGDLAGGDALARALPEPIARTAAEWAALRLQPRAVGLARINSFADAHPGWAANDWLRRRAEDLLLSDKRYAGQASAAFRAAPPASPAGLIVAARTLRDESRDDEAAAMIRPLWRDQELTESLETIVKDDFGDLLTRVDHKARADRLIYKERAGAGLRAAALAGPDVVALARARLAVAAEDASDKLMAAVPKAMQADPAYAFALAHKLRHADKIDEAVKVVLAAPRDPARVIGGDEWWIERRLLARKALDRGEPSIAYRLCDEHAAVSTASKIEAEFHAGWIALRFLNDAALAAPHFEHAAKIAETPMSRARAAYWQGRAAEALGQADNAAAAYARAAETGIAFYGQLARVKLGRADLAVRTPARTAASDERVETVRVVELLYAAGERELAFALALDAARNLTDEAQMAALGVVVDQVRDARTTLVLGKIATSRGFALDAMAFPTFGIPGYQPLPNSADRAIVLAIARQESEFSPGVVSGAGAKGLMQMIPSTARRTAEHAGVPFDEKRLLAEPAFNAQLGAAHLGELIGEHGGSLILAFAAYNAGGKHVKEWIDAYGDPRAPGVDPVDWIERIPFTETRNYVQRIIENLQVYHARFGQPVTLALDGDVRRARAGL